MGSHRVGAHKGTDAKGGGEEPREDAPPRRDGTLGPGHTGKEQQGDGGEDHHQNDVFAAFHHHADGYAEEEAGQEKGQQHTQQFLGACQGGKTEKTGDNHREVGEGEQEDGQVAKATAGQHHSRMPRGFLAVFAAGSGRHAHAQEQCLLEDE